MDKCFTTPLKDLCNNFKEDIVDGPFGANLKREHYQLQGIPVLKIQNIKPFKITLKKMDYVTEEKYLELQRHSYRSGDIIMTKLGDPLGESAIVESVDDGLIVADLVRIRAQKIDTRYLCYHLNSPVTNAYINAQQKGTTRPRVRISVVRDLPIYTPPISEQKRIVDLLDTVFSDLEQARAKTELNLKNVRELFDSYLQQVFNQKGEGWVEKKLIDVCVLQRGFDLPKRLRAQGKYPLVSSSGVTDTHVEAKVTGPGVVTGRSGSIGNVFYIEDDFWPLNTALYIKDFHGNDVKFVSWLLRCFDLSRFTSGAGVPTLNRNFVHNELVNIPSSIEEQSLLVTEIENLKDEVDKVTAIYKEKLDALDELKESILQKAFSGELTQD
jgi:type I restriction enzyme S subunit